MPVLLDQYPCVDPRLAYSECARLRIPFLDWWGKANSFRNVLGTGPGTGLVLLLREHLDKLLNKPRSTIINLTTAPGSGGYSAPLPPRKYDLKFSEYGVETKVRSVLIVDATCITPGAKDDRLSVYAVKLADTRHMMNRRPAGVRYNMVASSGTGYQSDSTYSGSTPWTWAQVVASLWAKAAPAASALTFPIASPHGTPENLDFTDSYALDALGIVLDRLGLALRWDHDQDSYSIVEIGGTVSPGLDLERNRRPQRWDDYPVEPTRPMVPDKVRVVFRIAPSDCDLADRCAIEVCRPDPPVGEEREPGTVAILFDDLVGRRNAGSGSGSLGSGSGCGSANSSAGSCPEQLARFGSCANLVNKCDLEARAIERARVYYRLLTKGTDRLCRVYEGAWPLIGPNERTKAVAIEDRGEGVVTTAYRGADVLPPFGLWDEWYRRQSFACGGAGGYLDVDIVECVSFTDGTLGSTGSGGPE